jgi:hypothetical protein
MAFNKEKFIADAKAAGYSDDEINAELAGSSQSSESSGWDTTPSKNSAWTEGQPPPLVSASAASEQAGPSPAFGKKVDEASKKIETKKIEVEQQAPVIPEFAQNPLLLAGAAAAGGATVLGWKTLRDKMSSGTTQPTARVEGREPSMFAAQRVDEPAWSASSAQNAPLSESEMMDRLRNLVDETSTVNEPVLSQGRVPQAPVAQQGPNLTLAEAQARMAGVTPPVPAAAPVEPPKPIVPSAAPNSPVTKAVTDTIQQLGQAETPVAAMPSRPVTPTPAAALPTGELKTGSGLTAYAGEGKPRERFPKEFKSTADIPKGYAFVPGMGPGTNVIRNDFGQAGYNALVQEQGGPFGEDKATRDFIKQYNEQRVGPPATRELRKSLGLPLPENTKGIPMKIAKVGGVIGAIMAIPDLANAAQNRDAGQAAAVASGFLPPAIQALIYSGGLNAGAEEEARQLRMRDYALKAGRGVAQGYDTRRLIGAAPPGQRELIPGMK